MSDPIIDEPRAGAEPPDEAEVRQREPVFNLSGTILFLIAACVGVQIFRQYLLSPREDMAFVVHMAFIPARYTQDHAVDLYDFTTPITYAFLHGGWTHLLVNMVWLAAFGSPLAYRLGSARFFAFWIFTALAAALFHFLAHPDDVVPVIGASGAISGMMGAASRFGFRMERHDGRPAFAGQMLTIFEALRSRAVLVFLAVWMIINVVTGLGFMTPGITNPIAWEAHIGGFLAGFFFLAPFVGPPGGTRSGHDPRLEPDQTEAGKPD
ncbi:MAG: rhomboid family intramembrane serine protease [Rhizobiales bacterium 65-79]|nr:MAG: rhomboid family intramembrane serine protease [Rhizobiales bacterium 65-79]